MLTYMRACVCGLVSLQYAHLHARVCVVWSVCSMLTCARVCVWSGQFAGLGMLTYMFACVCGLVSLQV